MRAYFVVLARAVGQAHAVNVDLGPNIRDQAGEIAQVTVITSKPSRWGCREIDNHRPFGAQEWFTRESFGNSAVATH